MILHMVSCLLLMTTLVHGSKYSEYINRQPAPPGYLYVAQNTDSAFKDYDDSDEEDYFDDSEYGNAPFLEYASTDEYPSFRDDSVNAHKGHQHKEHKHDSNEENRREHKHHIYHNYPYQDSDEFYNDGIRYTSQSHKNGNLRLVSPIVQNLQNEQQIARNAENYQQAREIVYLQNSDDRNSYILNSPIVNKIENTRNTQGNDNIGYLLNSRNTEQSQNNAYLQNAQDNKYAYVQSSPNIQQVNIDRDTYLQNSQEINRHSHIQDSPSVQQTHINRAEYLENPQTPHHEERTYLLLNSPKNVQEMYLKNSPTDRNIYLKNSPNVPNIHINRANYLQNSETPQVDPEIFLRNSPNRQHQDVYLQSSQIPHWPKHHLNRGTYLQKLHQEINRNKQQFGQHFVNSQISHQNMKFLNLKMNPNVEDTVINTPAFSHNSQNNNIRMPYIPLQHRPYTETGKMYFESSHHNQTNKSKPNASSPLWYRPDYIARKQYILVPADSNGNNNMRSPLIPKESNYQPQCPCQRYIFDRRTGKSSCYCPNIKYVTRQAVVMVCPGQNTECIPKQFCNNGIIDNNQYLKFKDTFSTDSCEALTHTCCRVMSLLKKLPRGVDSNQIYNYIHNSNITNFNNDITRYFQAENLVKNKNPTLELGEDYYEKILLGHILRPLVSNVYKRPVPESIYTNTQFEPVTQENGNIFPHLNHGLTTADHISNIPSDFAMNGNTNNDRISIMKPTKLSFSTTTTESVMKNPYSTSFIDESNYDTSNLGLINPGVIGTGLSSLLMGNIGSNGQILNLAGTIQTSHPDSSDISETSLNVNHSGEMIEFVPKVVQPDSSSLKIDINGLAGINQPELSEPSITMTESGMDIMEVLMPTLNQGDMTEPIMDYMDSIGTNTEDSTRPGNYNEHLNIYGLETIGYGIDTQSSPSSIRDFTGTKVDLSNNSNLDPDTVMGVKPNNAESSIDVDIDNLSSKFNSKMKMDASKVEITNESELGLKSPILENIKQLGKIGFGQPSIIGSTNNIVQSSSSSNEIITGTAGIDSGVSLQVTEGLGFSTGLQPSTITENQTVTTIETTQTIQPIRNTEPSTTSRFEIISTTGLPSDLAQTGADQSGHKVALTQIEQSGDIDNSLEGLRFSLPGMGKKQQSGIIGFGFINGEPQIPENSGQTITKTIITTSGPGPGSDQTFDQLKTSGFIYGAPQISENADQTITKTLVTTTGAGQGFGQRETTFNQFDTSGLKNNIPQTDDSSQTITKTTVTTSGSKLDSGHSETTFNKFDNSGFISGMPHISEESGKTITKTIVTSGSGQGSGQRDTTYKQFDTTGFVNGAPQMSEDSGQTITKTIVTTSGSRPSGTTFGQFDTSGFISGMPHISEESGKTITKTIITSGSGQGSGQRDTTYKQFDTTGFINGAPQMSEDSGQTITKTIVTTSGSRPSGTTFDQFDTSGFISGMPHISEESGKTITKTIVTSGSGQGSGQRDTTYKQFDTTGFINGAPQMSEDSGQTITKTIVTTSGSRPSGTTFDQFDTSGFISGMPHISEESGKTITKTIVTSGSGQGSGQSDTTYKQFDSTGFINGVPQMSENLGQTVTKTIFTTSGSEKGSRQNGTNFDTFFTSGFINGVPQISSNSSRTVTKTRVTTSESGQNGNGFGQFDVSGMGNAQQSGVFGQSSSSNGFATFSGKSRQMLITTDTPEQNVGSTNSVTNNIRQSGSVDLGQPDTTGSNTFGTNGFPEINNKNVLSVTGSSNGFSQSTDNTLTQTMTTTFVSNGTTEGSESVSGDAFGYESSIISAQSSKMQPAGQTSLENTEQVVENPIKDVLNGIPIAEIFRAVTPATNLDQPKNNSGESIASTKEEKPSFLTTIDDSDITVLLNNISKRVSVIRNLTITNATTSDIITYPTEDTVSVARMGLNINERFGKPFLVNDALPTKNGEVIRTTLSNPLANVDSLISSEYTENASPTIKRHTSALHELARSLNINTGSNIQVPVIDTQYSEVSKEPRTFEFFQNVLKRIGAATNIGHNNNYVPSVLYNNGISAHNQEDEIYLPITGQTLIPVAYEHNEFQPIERQEVIIQPIPEQIVRPVIEDPIEIQPIHKIDEIQTESPKKTKLVMNCPHRMQCVQSHFCTAAGVITTSPVRLTVEQVDQLLNCGDEDIGVYGKCCFTPNE